MEHRFIAHDRDGRILGIEVKRIGKMPEVNQWGHGLDIVAVVVVLPWAQ